MLANPLLREAQELRDVGQRLEGLADQYDHSHVADAILSICGAVRNNATMIEVLVATKFDDALPV